MHPLTLIRVHCIKCAVQTQSNKIRTRSSLWETGSDFVFSAHSPPLCTDGGAPYGKGKTAREPADRMAAQVLAQALNEPDDSVKEPISQ